MKVLDTILAKVALSSAKVAAGTASLWNSHQPKEPDMKNLK